MAATLSAMGFIFPCLTISPRYWVSFFPSVHLQGFAVNLACQEFIVDLSKVLAVCFPVVGEDNDAINIHGCVFFMGGQQSVHQALERGCHPMEPEGHPPKLE